MCPLDSASGEDPDRKRTRTRLKGVAPIDAAEKKAVPKTIGRYEVLSVIGKGAMGVVYKARDPLLDRVVAVKTIHAPSSLAKGVRKAFFERFEREAKAAARISHPAIVTIFDVGLAEEAPFLVMEYLPGETLADRLDRGARLSLSQSVQCARDLASALGFAHRERIVHRDVKPANVLHAGDGRWKLTDFGIARLPDSDLTQIGMFMGTPGYAPPEAIRDGRYTAQADVFAWGAVLYELLCGRVPYEGPDTQTTNGYVLKAEAPSPRTYETSLPEPLAQVALLALTHDTQRRFQNGADAEAALAVAWEQSLAAGLVPLGGTAVPASTAVPQSNQAQGGSRPHKAPPPSSPPPVPADAGSSPRPAAPSQATTAPVVAATRSRDEEPTVLDVAAQKRAEEQVTEPWMRSDGAGSAGADDNPLFPMPPSDGSAVPQRIDVEAERSRPREDSAQRVPRLDLGPAQDSAVSTPLVPQTSPGRPWAMVAVILSLLALAAVVAFYLVRG